MNGYDFGLAKPTDKLSGYASTATGTIVGSPFYMSPEQLKGKKDLTPASDVYAVGVLLYELFVGHPPHYAESFADVVLKAYTQTIPFDLPSIPSELRPILERCLKREVCDRYPHGRQAYNDFLTPLHFACERLRHDFFRDSWRPILNQELLEQFAIHHRGILPDDAASLFQQRLREQGLNECDSERLNDILPPIFARQCKVHAAEETEVQARKQLGTDISRLTSDQLRQRADEIQTIERSVTEARAKVTGHIQQLLAAEASHWQSPVETQRQETIRNRIENEIQQRIEYDRSRTEFLREQTRKKIRKYSVIVAGYLFAFLISWLVVTESKGIQKEIAEWLFMGLLIGPILLVAGVGAAVMFAPLTLVLELFRMLFEWLRRPVYGVEYQLTGHTGPVVSVALSLDGSRIASGSWDDTLRLWDANGVGYPIQLTGHSDSVRSIAFNSDGTRIASGSDDRTIRVWNASSGKEETQLIGHKGTVGSVAFSPDGSRIASASDDLTIRIWDSVNGKELSQLTGNTGAVRMVIFSHNGTRIASASDDKTVRIWDADSCQELARLEGHIGPVVSIAFSPDGTRIASGSWDHTLRIWDTATNAELLQIALPSSADSVAFSPDGSRIVSGSWDKFIRIWDSASGNLILELSGHTEPVRSVAFSSDGTRIVSGSDDKTICVWKLRK